MKVPLYDRGPGRAWTGQTAVNEANLGLVFDKFFDGWNPDCDDYEGKEAKSQWIQRITRERPAPLLEKALERQKQMVDELGGAVWYAVAASRFVTGTGIANPLENGFAFHHTLGVPYLTASGIKGAARNYWAEWHDTYPNNDRAAKEAEITKLMGSAAGGVGSVIFFDMLPTKPVKLAPEVMTPHYGDWYQHGASHPPGDWMSPTPIPFIAVEAGAVFQIAAAPRVFGDKEWANKRKKLKSILAKTLDITGLGAKTAVGYGRFLLAEANYWDGDTLAAGTQLYWEDADLSGKTTAPVLLKPNIEIELLLENGETDTAHISYLRELNHIK